MKTFLFLASFLVSSVLSALSDVDLLELQLRKNYLENDILVLFDNVKIDTLDELLTCLRILLKISGNAKIDVALGIDATKGKIIENFVVTCAALQTTELSDNQELPIVHGLKKFQFDAITDYIPEVVPLSFARSLNASILKYLGLYNESLFDVYYQQNGKLISKLKSLRIPREDKFKNYGSNIRYNALRGPMTVLPDVKEEEVEDDTIKFFQASSKAPRRSAISNPSRPNVYREPIDVEFENYINAKKFDQFENFFRQNRNDADILQEEMRRGKERKMFSKAFTESMEFQSESLEPLPYYQKENPFYQGKEEKQPDDQVLILAYFGLDKDFPFDLKRSQFKCVDDLFIYLDSQKMEQEGDSEVIINIKLQIKDNLKLVTKLLCGQVKNEQLLVNELVKLEYQPLDKLMGLSQKTDSLLSHSATIPRSSLRS